LRGYGWTRPEFIVLYNGESPYPDETTLKLSGSFEDAAAAGLIKNGPESRSPAGSLELTVKVYNINEGRNKAMARNCQRLFWYSAFIAKVREFEKTAPDKETAMKKAVRYCIDHDIMKAILQAHASEVINMLLEEWNTETAKKVWQREAREEGEIKVLELVRQGYTSEQIEAKLSLNRKEYKDREKERVGAPPGR
jgi:hypothetical protein